jgi:hypothetical protein
MAVASTPLIEEARRIFTELGYTVEDDGPELRAERKWRIVYVTTAAPAEASERGDMRCFVVREENAPDVRRDLLDRGPDYDWAVIGVDGDGDHHVHHPLGSQELPP